MFDAGVRACVPAVPGVVSFGMVVGAGTVAAGVSPEMAIVATLALFAGTLQLAAFQLAAGGAPLAVIAVAGLVINLRFVITSLAISAHLRGLPAALRVIAAYVLTDNAFGTMIARFEHHPGEPGRAAYYFGASAVIWLSYEGGAIAGALVGAAIPAHWQLEFTVTLTFLGLAVHSVRDRATAMAAIAAGVTAILAAGLPFRLGLILAAAAGIFAGTVTEKWTRPQF